MQETLPPSPEAREPPSVDRLFEALYQIDPEDHRAAAAARAAAIASLILEMALEAPDGQTVRS